MDDVTYKHYVKKGLWTEFRKVCENNSKDFYGCGIVLSTHFILKDLMQHTYEDVWKEDKVTPKEAFDHGMNSVPIHSGSSAEYTASMVSHFSPRGEEFKVWWDKENGGK